MGRERVTPEATIRDPYNRGAAGIMCRETTLGEVLPGELFVTGSLASVIERWALHDQPVRLRGRGCLTHEEDSTPVVVIAVVQRARPVPRKGATHGQ